MKITSKLLLLLLSVTLSACGVKAPPVARGVIILPPPMAVDFTLKDGGVLIKNYGDNDTIIVERILNVRSSFENNTYREVAVIRPRGEFLDTSVRKDMDYVYRYRKYDPINRLYSQNILRPLKFFTPITLGAVIIEDKGAEACVTTKIDDKVIYANIMVNNKLAATIKNDNATCVKLPPSLQVNISIIPFDVGKNPGIAYNKQITRNPNNVLLPPQNIKVLRKGKAIVLSWDKYGEGSRYKIYSVETKLVVNNDIDNATKFNLENKNSTNLYDKFDRTIASAFNKKIENNLAKSVTTTKVVGDTDVTVFSHNIKEITSCYNYEISTIRGGKESEKAKVRTCP